MASSQSTYSHKNTLPYAYSINNRVAIAKDNQNRYDKLTNICLLTYDIATLCGIKCNYFSPENDYERLTIPLDKLSSAIGSKVFSLKGWDYFQSCVKGFNSLGLIAEQVITTLQKYQESQEEYYKDKEIFLSSRYLLTEVESCYPDIQKYYHKLKAKPSNSQAILPLAIWKTLHKRPIICSTSSNMGISLHECIRAFQSKPIIINDKEYVMLNPDEGSLRIWCPDEKADFMNNEKSNMLHSLQEEHPKSTTLKTYINRQQRDPGALSEALSSGGYFFPTNPQSEEEIQNLLFVGLKELAEKQKCNIDQLLFDDNVTKLLDSLCAYVKESQVIVTRGVEGGIGGLMLPYFIMIEEHLRFFKGKYKTSTWNQASIGAALAATVIADQVLQNNSLLKKGTLEEFNKRFKFISDNWNKVKKITVSSHIHGLFDLANIQSLAQLLGVVVLRHTSGRGTAFVGLGSSSYSNGNLCFDILNDSAKNSGSFKGGSSFHPATHTLNYFSQAIIYGEGIYLEKLNNNNSIKFIKPEPAGAAALAGYLLYLLDHSLLSIYEIAFLLKIYGYTTSCFLSFTNFSPSQEGKDSFIQLAFEEGPFMGNLAANILNLLQYETEELRKYYLEESRISKKNRSKLKKSSFMLLENYIYYIYMTGDNTEQPSNKLREQIILNQSLNALEDIPRYSYMNKQSVFNKILGYFT
ncbi:hypothetical protein [Prochlorococcus marinus]|uniref:hypothetical protein n=1 Tax=Prochlorococcus marinus TaxID=1219 RepID=UPI0022B5D494|nr:hypothetical protein [Prochlorococcus marinus]